MCCSNAKVDRISWALPSCTVEKIVPKVPKAGIFMQLSTCSYRCSFMLHQDVCTARDCNVLIKLLSHSAHGTKHHM